MPVSPSPNFLQQFGMQAPQAPTGPIAQQQLPMAQPLMPSWMRTGFEGGTDALLGMVGIGGGPNASKMNQVGQLGAAAIPMMGGIGLASRIKPAMQAAPEAGEIGNLISEMSNNLRKIPGGQNPIYDEAGRYLGLESPMQTAKPTFELPPQMMNVSGPRAFPSMPNEGAYNAHVASSVNKNVIPKPQGYAPSTDQLESLMAKYKK